jgi:transcriptional regulator with XRE-family HTH domain
MPRPPKLPEEEELAKALGQVIHKARKRLDMKAEGLAFDVGVSPQTVSRWENGKALPYTPHLYKVSKILGLPLSRIFAAAELFMLANSKSRKHGMAVANPVHEGL